MTTLDLAEQMNRDGGGFGRAMGIRFVRATAEEVVAELEVNDTHRQVHGIVHGGVHAALVETVCSVGATAAILDRGQVAVGLENHTSFVRAVRSGRLVASARPLNVGQSTQLWEATVSDEGGRLVATGRVRLYCLAVDAQLAVGPTTRST